MIKELESFGKDKKAKFREDFVNESKAANAVAKHVNNGHISLEEASQTLEDIGDKNLAKDDARKAAQGTKEVNNEADMLSRMFTFSQIMKDRIASDPEAAIRGGILIRKPYIGSCLICGKSYNSGDIVLAEKNVSNSICLECCDDGNTSNVDNELIIVA